jgi:uncharacterized protein YeaO (DUF488 family)
MLQVKTSQIRNQAQDRLDITAKSSTGLGRWFAPTWPMVMAYKRGQLNQAGYTEQYLNLLRSRYASIEGRAAFDELLSRESVTLVCYCRPGDFCHRVILAEQVLSKLGAVYHGEVKP